MKSSYEILLPVGEKYSQMCNKCFTSEKEHDANYAVCSERKKKKLNKSDIRLGSSLFMVCLVYSHNVTPRTIKLSEEHRLAHRLTRKTYTTFLKELPISINHWSVNEVTGHLQGIFTYTLLAACAVTRIRTHIWRSPLIWLFCLVRSTKWCVKMQIKHEVLSDFPENNRGSSTEQVKNICTGTRK